MPYSLVNAFCFRFRVGFGPTFFTAGSDSKSSSEHDHKTSKFVSIITRNDMLYANKTQSFWSRSNTPTFPTEDAGTLPQKCLNPT